MQPVGFITLGRLVQPKLRNQSRGKNCSGSVLQFFSLGCNNSCCLAGAAALSSGRPRQPAASSIYRTMGKQTHIRRYRFDVFDTCDTLVSNGKSHEGKAGLTRLTHLTSNRRGCMLRARPRTRQRPLALLDTPLSVGVKSVKHVKSPTQSCDSSLTFGVKRGVNLTQINVRRFGC